MVVRSQVRLAELPAPTGMEAQRGRLVHRWLQRAGLRRVSIDAAGNVVATRPATVVEAGPRRNRPTPVVVLAHLDTIFPEGTACSVHREGDRLVGPGIGDNSRGLAGMLALATVLSDPGLQLRRPILFAATTGEEGSGDLRGAKHLFGSLPEEPAAAIALDGPGDSGIVHKAVGSRRFRVDFTGPGGHSWASAGAANPVHAAGRATRTIAEYSIVQRTHPSLALAVTRIGGGLSVNAIPESSWLEVDVRGLDEAALDSGERVVRNAVEAAVGAENDARAAWSEPCRAQLVRTGCRPAGTVDADSPLVRLAMDATRLVHREPLLSAASTDANVPIALGIQAITIGAGGTGGGTHTTNEWYENRDGPLGLERALLVVAAAADR